MKKKTFGVFGLGRFGTSIVEELSKSGADVIAVDSDPALVQKVSSFATVAIVADVCNQNAMRELGLSSMDAVMIAMAGHLESTIMAIVQAKEAGVPVVWAKARDDTQKMVFEKLGADRVMIPEREAGISVAKNMVSADLLDLIELTENIRLVELAVREDWVGYSLKELDFRKKYRINVIAIKRGKNVSMELGADDKLEAGTTLYVIGDRKAINKL
jgi:trk system potassium uptake protein TrkA